MFLKHSLVQNGLKDTNLALFGSALSGNFSTESDIDLIIVSDDFDGMDIFERAHMTMAAEMETLRKFKVPLDILNMTSKEYQDTISGFIYRSKIVA
ncbi:MAG: nucleotidyltransferase domain-containing protein [Bacteroidetes bacterium]|nr:nucleotidyltransferase domain-containing protein [Bacteroidota bacterium]